MPPTAPVDPLTQLEAARFGIYVHFPYCLSKCPYCDFASIVAKEVPEARYAKAVERELDKRLAVVPALRGRTVDSIFLGGGTPSLWDARYVGALLERLAREFTVAPAAEITLEANPGASDTARFADFRSAGINRLSIGVQSFQSATLAALGRAHDGALAKAAFRAARAAGLENVSMDFIYGVHGQTLEQVEADAREAVALGPDHLSAYALTLEKEALAEEVPLARQLARGEVTLPPDDTVLSMADAVARIYSGAGLEKYETSNHARPGFHSRHNALYWTGGEYLALGAGATGFLRTGDRTGERYQNPRSAEVYFASVEAHSAPTPSASVEPLTAIELFEERVAMGLRLGTGVDLVAACAEYGQPYERRQAIVDELVRGGFAFQRGSLLTLTSRGANVHSAISARLL
jgi:putative oxygen-independent coproporphyrinogen III oxidase